MTKQAAGPGRITVWLAMADHFLDTETRHDIPLTALLCVEAGWSCERARDAWRHEVSPAVAFNLWSVAGEWAGWDREWLVARIERLRSSWHNRPGTLKSLRYRLRAPGMDGVWVAMPRCTAPCRRITALNAPSNASPSNRPAIRTTPGML